MSSTHTRAGHLLRPVAIPVIMGLVSATAVTAAVVLPGTTHRAKPPLTVALTSGEAIDIAQGISITPAPGWTLGVRGPDWVALHNTDTSAEMRVAVKPAGGTDVVAVLQTDMNQYTSSAGLANVRNLSAPNTQPLQSANFQQEASIDYTADVSAPQSAIPVLGTFSELLNTSNGQSAFIDFRQNNNATPQAVDDGGLMIRSLE
jgi:hypothetical protein